MNKEKQKNMMSEFKDLMEKMLLDDGEVTPTLGIVAVKILPDEDDDDKPSDHLMICPLPDQLLSSKEVKVFLVEEVLPKLGRKIRAEGLKIIGVNFVYVGMVKTIPKDTLGDRTPEEIVPEDLENLKAKEILFHSYQSKDMNVVQGYNIKREGKSVNEEGELIDNIKLVKSKELSTTGKNKPEIGGIFSNLFEYLTK